MYWRLSACVSPPRVDCTSTSKQTVQRPWWPNTASRSVYCSRKGEHFYRGEEVHQGDYCSASLKLVSSGTSAKQLLTSDFQTYVGNCIWDTLQLYFNAIVPLCAVCKQGSERMPTPLENASDELAAHDLGRKKSKQNTIAETPLSLHTQCIAYRRHPHQ